MDSNYSERFKLNIYENDPDFIHLDNPSPMMLICARNWFRKELGDDAIIDSCIGGFFGGFQNAFKVPRAKELLLREKILPYLVTDADGYYLCPQFALK